MPRENCGWVRDSFSSPSSSSILSPVGNDNDAEGGGKEGRGSMMCASHSSDSPSNVSGSGCVESSGLLVPFKKTFHIYSGPSVIVRSYSSIQQSRNGISKIYPKKTCNVGEKRKGKESR